MKAAVDFLNRLGRIFDLVARPTEGRTNLVLAMEDAAFDALRHLMKQEAEPAFAFVDGEVIFANRRVPRLSDWKWTRELNRCGIERIEISRDVAREEFGSFLALLVARLHSSTSAVIKGVAPTSKAEFPHIRFGRLSDGEHIWTGEEGPDSPRWLQEEAEAAGWLLGQAARGEEISYSLTGAVVQSLSAVLHREESVLSLLIPLEDADQYTAIHSVNAALLAMGLAEALGFAGADVAAVGEAAILHDVGTARVPDAITGKPGELSSKEWQVLKRHPADGARMLIDSGPEMELAATVAYEHHINYDGSGYPNVRYARKLHRATQCFQVCDVYDALRTRRPYRDPWPVERIVTHLKAESGRSLYPDAVEAFTWMLAG